MEKSTNCKIFVHKINRLYNNHFANCRLFVKFMKVLGLKIFSRYGISYAIIFVHVTLWRGDETAVNLYSMKISINSILYDVKYYSIILLL